MDDGLGIPPEVLPRIRQRFITTNDAGQGGALILDMSYRSIKQDHGTVDLYRQPVERLPVDQTRKPLNIKHFWRGA